MKPLQKFAVGAALGVSLLTMPAQAQNLVTNGNFADEFNGWGAAGASVTTTGNNRFQAGSYAAHLHSPNAFLDQEIQDFNFGDFYRGSIEVKGTGTFSMGLQNDCVTWRPRPNAPPLRRPPDR